jgi:hypothetical protein
MKIVIDKISLDELKILAEESFGDFVKAVVDIENEIMAVGAEFHADEETILLNDNSEQKNLWGINIHTSLPRDKWIEFDSMINIRPRQNNRTRGVDDKSIRDIIIKVVNKLVV